MFQVRDSGSLVFKVKRGSQKRDYYKELQKDCCRAINFLGLPSAAVSIHHLLDEVSALRFRV